MNTLLVVEDHDSLREGIVETFQRTGYQVAAAPDAETGIRLLAEQSFETVITDMSLPGKTGLDVLKAAKAKNPLTTVIVMTAYGTVDNAVEAMRLGAIDYLQKPFQIEELELKISRSFEHLTSHSTLAAPSADGVPAVPSLIGNSPALKEVIRLIHKVANSSSTVLIEGETGTGKELIADALHAASGRAGKPLIKVNCAALPEPLLESELFGHERGAFTGAERRRMGRFELADGGSLFLDEVAEITAATQAKLLRALQDHAFERVGGETTIKVDVRLIAATNKHLYTEVCEHRFREDLFYRLNVVTITLPPLRERPDDIPLLARAFLKRYRDELAKRVDDIAPDALDILQRHAWPGNIRELENTMERAVLMAEADVIRPCDLGALQSGHPVRPTPVIASPQPSASKRLDDVERATIIEALTISHWIQKEAARLLGISPRVLNYKIKTYGLTHPSWIKYREPKQRAG